MNKKITLLLLGLFAVAINAKSANAIGNTPFNIDNTDFTIRDSSNNVDNTLGINNAAGNSTINTTANPNGFNSKFDTTGGNTFLLLGATDDASSINAGGNTTLNGTNSVATSIPFAIDSTNISDGAINFKFDYSFQGNFSPRDNFAIQVRPEGSNATGAELVFRNTYSEGSEDINLDLGAGSEFNTLGFTNGDYEMAILLNESNGDTRNSAAGFDNFSVSSVPTPVPFGAAPNTGIFILGSLYAGSSYLKRRKMSK